MVSGPASAAVSTGSPAARRAWPTRSAGDEAPADVKKITDALAVYREAVKTGGGLNGNHDDVLRAVEALTGLTGAELDAAIGKLDDNELRDLNAAITRGDGLIATNGLEEPERFALANTLFSKVGTVGVRRLATFVPALHPTMQGDQPDLRYAEANGHSL